MTFMLQSKNEMYLNFKSAIYRESGDPLRFTYPADHPLAAEFEEQKTTLAREYRATGNIFRFINPDTPGALDDAFGCVCVVPDGSGQGAVGDILFV